MKVNMIKANTYRNWTTALLAGSLMLSLSLSLTAQEKTAYQGLPGSKVKVDGTSNIHDWSVESRIIGGTIEFDSRIATNPAEALKAAPKVEVMIPVRSLKSGNTKMDEIMMETMEEKAQPRITYNVTKLTLKEPPAAAGGPFKVDAIGLLTVHGVTVTNQMVATIEPQPGDKLKITGNTEAKMTAFGMKPPAPTIAGGAISTGDDVKISFEWITRKKAGK